ncbi:uncharacterized protein LOC144150106 isoform X2 [Haemaphysalis longicornis]
MPTGPRATGERSLGVSPSQTASAGWLRDSLSSYCTSRSKARERGLTFLDGPVSGWPSGFSRDGVHPSYCRNQLLADFLYKEAQADAVSSGGNRSQGLVYGYEYLH